MFGTVITETALTDERAQSAFAHKVVEYGSFGGDISWLSTLRALLYDKLSDNDRVDLFCSSIARPRLNVTDICRALKSDHADELTNALYCYNVTSISDEDVKKIDPLEIVKELDGFVYISRVTELFRKNFTVFCFANEERKTSIVIGFNLTIARYHYLQCATVGMIPWWFTGTLSDKDKAVLYSLRGATSTEYYDLMKKIADEIGLREIFLKEKLSGFENRYSEIQAKRIRETIETAYQMIADHENSIHQLLQSIEHQEFEYDGIQKKINSKGESEILEYFLTNKHLDLVSADDNNLEYIVFDYLSSWDIDLAERMIGNRDSYFYYDYRNKPCNADWEMLLKAIFINEELKLRFCSRFDLDITRSLVNGIRHYDYPSEYSNYMPNPHIDQYGCVGNFEKVFRECMKNHDYIMAIANSIISGMSLNFSDATVMERFIGMLLGNYETGTKNATHCIELPDGTVTNYKGAIAYLKNKEAGNE